MVIKLSNTKFKEMTLKIGLGCWVWGVVSVFSKTGQTDSQLFNSHIRQWMSRVQRRAGEGLTWLPRTPRTLTCSISEIHGIETPRLANFKLPLWNHQMQNCAGMCITGSYEPVWAGSITPMNKSLRYKGKVSFNVELHI